MNELCLVRVTAALSQRQRVQAQQAIAEDLLFARLQSRLQRPSQFVAPKRLRIRPRFLLRLDAAQAGKARGFQE